MEDSILKAALIVSAIFAGLLCGASLDQSIKQLPARRRTGVKIFSSYAKAADLKNGIVWYAVLGIGMGASSIFTAVYVWSHHSHALYSIPVFLAGAFAIGQLICTSIAAPTYHKQKEITDEGGLEKLFNKFEFVQAVRSVFIVLNFLSLVLAIWLVMGV
jgi:hypothetical protein